VATSGSSHTAVRLPIWIYRSGLFGRSPCGKFAERHATFVDCHTRRWKVLARRWMNSEVTLTIYQSGSNLEVATSTIRTRMIGERRMSSRTRSSPIWVTYLALANRSRGNAIPNCSF